jgi:hypothetical protein
MSGRQPHDSTDAAADYRAIVVSSRRAQGLPPTIEDAHALRKIEELMGKREASDGPDAVTGKG